MTSGARTIVLPVTDLAAAKAVWTELLGVEPVQDQPYYVGYETPGQHIGLDPNGHREGMTVYWHVEDLAGTLDGLVKAGATEVAGAKNVGGGRLIATVKDPAGNLIGLLQPGPEERS